MPDHGGYGLCRLPTENLKPCPIGSLHMVTNLFPFRNGYFVD